VLQQKGWRVTAAAIVMLAGLATLAGPWLHLMPGVHRVLATLGCGSLA
jgi:hypothetical protein